MSIEPRRLGKYELRERLARGGQGEVWKAFDPQLRRYVAIKQLHTNMQSDPDFASRFEREGQFIASLHHSNIMKIHDFQLVQDPGSDTTTAYMVMDYIEGPTLADYIRNTSRKGQFPAADDIVYIFTAISHAIDYAHKKGMIHRDIKPANIMLDRRSPKGNSIGEPILTDFGIAKLQGGFADTTKVLGTPLYVSPEQAQGLVGDKRSDLYSLGIILYEMTTGVTPFRGDSLMVILMQHFQDSPTPPALINPNLPPALSEVILKSIAKDPDARFPSASAMTIAVAESLNIPVPADLRRATATPDSNRANSYNPLQPSWPLGMAPTSLPPSSFPSSPSPTGSSPSTFTPTANDRQTPSTALAGSRPESDSFLSPGANTPTNILIQPARQRRTVYIVLIALLVAAVVGSGLLFAFFALDKSTTPSSPNSVVGNVRFLSSPNAPPGNIDEAITTIQHIPAAPSGEQYYAWLDISSEKTSSNHWPLTPLNNSLSSTYMDQQHNNLLTNNPHLFLITLEAAGTDPITPNNMPNNRIYYASLPTNIHNSASFVMRMCPQGSSNNICFS
jgi:eukaryotic-like serine/threonine-protein kinase